MFIGTNPLFCHYSMESVKQKLCPCCPEASVERQWDCLPGIHYEWKVTLQGKTCNTEKVHYEELIVIPVCKTHVHSVGCVCVWCVLAVCVCVCGVGCACVCGVSCACLFFSSVPSKPRSHANIATLNVTVFGMLASFPDSSLCPDKGG